MEVGNQDIGVTNVILTTAKSKKHKHGFKLVYRVHGSWVRATAERVAAWTVNTRRAKQGATPANFTAYKCIYPSE